MDDATRVFFKSCFEKMVDAGSASSDADVAAQKIQEFKDFVDAGSKETLEHSFIVMEGLMESKRITRSTSPCRSPCSKVLRLSTLPSRP